MSVAGKPGRLRVLQCITRLGLGGAERVALSIVESLRSQVDFGVFTVHGASRDKLGAEMRSNLLAVNVPWFAGTHVPMKCGGMIPGGFALGEALREFQPDVLHFHSETPEACGATLLRLGGGRQVALVRTIHNSVFWRYWPRTGRWCDRQLAPALIACVSQAAREEFERYRRESGAPPPPAAPTIVYNGVALPVQEPRRGPRASDVRRVLYAGRFEWQKGTDVLCRALPLVSLPGGVRGELDFVGHGAHQARIEGLARHPPSGWTVRVLPTSADLPQLFSHYDVVVMPSRFEGLGLIAVEATLCGLPVVTTDAPGLREALPPTHPWRATPGGAAALARSLGLVFDEASRWHDVVRAAQQFARSRFNLAVMGAGYRELYQHAAERQRTVSSRAA